VEYFAPAWPCRPEPTIRSYEPSIRNQLLSVLGRIAQLAPDFDQPLVSPAIAEAENLSGVQTDRSPRGTLARGNRSSNASAKDVASQRIDTPRDDRRKKLRYAVRELHSNRGVIKFGQAAHFSCVYGVTYQPRR